MVGSYSDIKCRSAWFDIVTVSVYCPFTASLDNSIKTNFYWAAPKYRQVIASLNNT
jgi:hypothetical protein